MSAIGQIKTAWAVILILMILPVLRWAQIYPLEYRFLDLGATMGSLGQITALSGMTLFSINLILSGRFKIFDRLMGGLSDVYNKHHVIGAISFSLILFHPVFLAFRLVPYSLRDAALFLLPGQNQAINYGIISILLFILLIVLTFFTHLRYSRWKISHTFMILVAFFAIMHSLTTTSDISRDQLLRFYILGLAFLGFTSAFYQAFLSKYLRKKYIYTIKNVSSIGIGTVEIEMSPKEERLAFEAGQFIFISFSCPGISKEIHPFSISSGENDPNLRIAIKSLGDFTKDIGSVRAGYETKIEGPYGKFTRKKDMNKNQVWIAGGIGITPFLSMARSLKDDCPEIDLYYSVKNKDEAAFLDELKNISKSHPNLKVTDWFSNDKGRLSGHAIYEMSNGLSDKDIFLCGPPPFMKSIRAQLIELGISSSKIHWELFNLYSA